MLSTKKLKIQKGTIQKKKKKKKKEKFFFN